MNRVLQFPNEQAAREQAGVWIARLDRGLTASECAELQQWLQQNPRHRSTLFHMAQLWDRMDVLAEISELFPLASRQVHVGHRWLRAGAAAALLAAGLAAVFIWPRAPETGGDPRLAADGAVYDSGARYRTGIGEQRLVTLPDGSVVTLNTDTLVAVRYAPAGRRVELLRGEAHFKVARDEHRAFTVRVSHSEFTAVGTAFNLRRTSTSGVELTVTEGRVKVLVAPQAGPRMEAAPMTELAPILVDAGRELLIDSEARPVQLLPPARIEARLAWTQGMMVIDNEPLEQAIREVSRYSTVRVVIADPELEQIPVAGYFRVGDINGLVAALQANFEIDADRDGDTVVLRARRSR